jgi:cytochrome c biogenesis protein
MVFLTKFYSPKVLKNLASLNLAIGLLVAIGISTALGTVIEQDQPILFYKENYPSTSPILGFIDWKFILRFNLNVLYTNFWFLSLLSFFAASLLACTYTTQIPSLKNFRLWKFLQTYNRFRNFQLKGQVPRNLANTSLYHLHDGSYHVFRQGKKNYAYTGLLGRLGPIIVHFSIIFILLGSSTGVLGGYTVQEIVPRGEVFHLQNFVKYGNLSQIPQLMSWRVNDFWITYTSDLKVNQFYSDISILNSRGSELKRKIIFVNEPLIYKGISLYQTDWDILGLKLQINENRSVQIPLKKITKSGRNFWLGSLLLGDQNQDKITVLLNDLTGNIYLYDIKGALISKIKIGQSKPLTKNKIITVKEVITTTGLQLKEDPGLNIVYISFFLLILSIYISFLSYSQIWGIEENDKLILAGKSNRAVLSFQEQFKRNIKKVYRIN